jgi:23S rRNA (uracil1939-C5)-methyltransferase
MHFELIPLKLVYGGDALGHHAGRPVLVPRVLPGERVEAEAIRTAKGVVHARPLRILEPSPARIDPPCPYFGRPGAPSREAGWGAGRCGGCQYQHLNTEDQAAAKKEILRETLRRIGKITWDAEIRLHTGPAWNYRNQAQLKVARQPDGKVALGFFEAESTRLFPVDVCLILSPRLNAILGELRSANWSSRLGACCEIELLADDRDEKVMLTLRGNLEADVGPGLAPACIRRLTDTGPQARADPAVAGVSPTTDESEELARDCLARLPGVVSVACGPRSKPSRRPVSPNRPPADGLERGGRSVPARVFGESALFYRVNEIQYQISPGSFFQSSRFLLPELVTAVTEDESGSTALDLFAGVGLFTLPLARRFDRVISVEASPQSSSDLAANARAHALGNIRPVTGTVFDFLRRCAQSEPNLVILDPPRAGVGIKTLKYLVALRPKRLHYVSCSPPTLARDLGFITAHGYRLNFVELFDLFPQTYHIESVAKLTRD